MARSQASPDNEKPRSPRGSPVRRRGLEPPRDLHPTRPSTLRGRLRHASVLANGAFPYQLVIDTYASGGTNALKLVLTAVPRSECVPGGNPHPTYSDRGGVAGWGDPHCRHGELGAGPRRSAAVVAMERAEALRQPLVFERGDQHAHIVPIEARPCSPPRTGKITAGARCLGEGRRPVALAHSRRTASRRATPRARAGRRPSAVGLARVRLARRSASRSGTRRTAASSSPGRSRPPIARQPRWFPRATRSAARAHRRRRLAPGNRAMRRRCRGTRS
jgi:hypothetical protein